MNPHLPADAALDAWTSHVLDVHFDPEDGTPFWLEWAEERGVDPREAVDGFDDLADVFEPFDEGVLREIPVERFHPRGLDGERRVYETGGTTGPPKRVVMVDYWRAQARWADGVLPDAFPRGNVLMLGPPGGANNAGVFVQHLAHEWDALPFHVTMDPRWAKRLSERRSVGAGARPGPSRAHDTSDGREAPSGVDPGVGFEAYVSHLIDQAERVLDSQDVTVLFTTARFLERPRVRSLVEASSVEAVYHGGTALDRDTHRIFREEWYADVAVAGEYGNTLMGVAQEAPPELRDPADRDYSLDYVPCLPYFVPEIVDEEGNLVGYGERGTVRLTVLNEEFFLPNLRERDAATRVEGVDPYPWDWVRDPGTAPERQSDTVEGVY